MGRAACLAPSLLILLILAVIGLCLLFCRAVSVVLVLIVLVLVVLVLIVLVLIVLILIVLILIVLILIVLHMRVSSFLVRRSCGILP